MPNMKEVDNPLISRSGVPLSSDNFYDSTERINNANGTNDLRYGNSHKLWDINPNDFYNDPGRRPSETNKKFDLGKFNIEFEKNKGFVRENEKILDNIKLNKLTNIANTETAIKPLKDLTIREIIINTKNAIFGIIDDIVRFRFEQEIFTKNNRMFYIGITIIFIVTIVYIYMMIKNDNNHTKNTDKNKLFTNNTYHVYQYQDAYKIKKSETI